ncbi:MAG: PAS domain S-box protein [Candidatus Marinimicrobia bacterium]|nr:PAS domain S-box protein [Candidatus Neomarinimicrobiota bacterium]
MNDGLKSREQLLVELALLRQQNSELQTKYSEHNQHDQTLKQNEEKYRELFEKSKDAFLILENRRFVDCNQATVDMLHYKSKPEFLETHPSALSPEEQPDGRNSAEKAEEMMDMAVANGNHRFEWYHKRNNGEIFPVEVLLTTISSAPEMEIIHTVWRDITERKKAEETLRTSQQFNESLLNTSPDIIYIYDMLESKIIYSNEGVTGVLGYSLAEVESMGDNILTTLMHPEDFKTYQKTIVPRYFIAADGMLIEHEYRMRHKNGEWRWLHSKELIFLRHENGKPQLIFGVNSNITERKANEQSKLDFEKKILHTQKLESLGVLAGGIAHDFNNILMAILGYADLAISNADLHSPAVEYLHGIMHSSRKAADMIKQILAYSGKGKFTLETINLNALLVDTAQMFSISVSKKAVLEYIFSSDPVIMEGDPAQIRQMIMNLVINASESFSEKSGVIELSTGQMSCDQNYINESGFGKLVTRRHPLEPGLYVYLDVKDSGCGMNSKTLQKIFDPFFTTKFTGRGLGLSAVLGITNGHNGMVKIQSEENQGTTFRILFPFFETNEELEETEQQYPTAAENWEAQGLFLIADDEESIRTIGKHMLRKMGFEVLTAPDGRQAVEIFEKHGDEIVGVLLDLTMPYKDGSQVFQEIRKLKPDIKVILSSGYNELDATQHFIGQGLAGFIQKPFVSAELTHKIREIFLRDA